MSDLGIMVAREAHCGCFMRVVGALSALWALWARFGHFRINISRFGIVLAL